MKCVFCRADLSIKGNVSRRDTCPHCQGDLRCCKQCNYYDPSAYNECREVSSERIMDKERANFCDYFVLKGSSAAGNGHFDKTNKAKAALEALFKKK